MSQNYGDFWDKEILDEIEYDILTPREVMCALGVGRNTFYRLVASGELRGFRIGKLWRVRRDELREFCNRSG